MHRTQVVSIVALAGLALAGCQTNSTRTSRYTQPGNDTRVQNAEPGQSNGAAPRGSYQTAGGFQQPGQAGRNARFNQNQNGFRNDQNSYGLQHANNNPRHMTSSSSFADGESDHFNGQNNFNNQNNPTSYSDTREFGQRFSPSNLNLFGDVIAESLPTELSSYGESPDTANFSQVTFTHEGSDFDPALTPDGKTIVFASTQHRHTADLYRRDVSSQVITQLTSSPFNDVMPAISPDGQRVAFSSDRNGNWDLFIMPTNGGKAVQVTHEGAHELHGSWSADGQKLAFSRLGEVSGRWEIWVIDLHNPAVAHFLGFGLFPEWCPVGATGRNGGDQIVFQRSRERGERAFSIWTIDYNSGRSENPSQVAFSTFSALINPTWSPDGKQIVYASVPNPSEWPNFVDAEPEAAAIHMVNANGSGLVTLTAGGSVDLMPFWGRDGNIYYVSDRNGSENIWSMSASEAIYAATGLRPSNNGIAGVPETP